MGSRGLALRAIRNDPVGGFIASASCHASGGGGTIERPVSASTIEPSAGQYIRHAVHPG